MLEIEDYYVDAHSLILNLNTSNYYTLELSTSYVTVYLLYTFEFALPLTVNVCVYLFSSYFKITFSSVNMIQCK